MDNNNLKKFTKDFEKYKQLNNDNKSYALGRFVFALVVLCIIGFLIIMNI